MNDLKDAAQMVVDSSSSTVSKRLRRRGAAEWREWIDRQARSGQSIAAFCREHGLAASGFHQWRRRLQSWETSAGDSSATFVRLEPAGDGQAVTVQFGPSSTVRARESALALP